MLFYLQREKFERELKEEMRFHIEMKAKEKRRGGMEEKQAMIEAPAIRHKCHRPAHIQYYCIAVDAGDKS